MIHFQHLRRRKYFAVADFICVGLAVALAFYIRTKVPLPVFTGLLPEGLPAGFESFWIPASVLGFAFMFMQYAFGVYDLWHSSSTANWLQRVLPANIAMLAASFTYLYLAQNFNFPRSLLVAMFFVNYLLSTFWRVAYFKVTEADMSEVVLVGKWADLSKLISELSEPPFSSSVRVVAVFVPDYTSDVPHESARNYLVLPFEEFDSYTNKNPYTSVILAPSDSFQHRAFNCVLSAAKRGVNIYAVPTIYEILLGRLQHLRINDLPLLELRLKPPSGLSLAFKRLFDFVFASFLILLLSMPMAFIALVIKFTSPGPVLYKQKRVGQYGADFVIVKFRSMVRNAELIAGFTQAKRNDPRLTKIGKFLRATRLDELPQLWNILRGDMSFVGPRPLLHEEVESFQNFVVGFSERHRVRPGVTGLAQVSGNYVTSPDVKLKYDLAYISNQNLFFDAQILFRTLKTVLTRGGQ
jgi:exopolysaccharide biosynthesis polyprenyl glycosylphosphotransferase